MKTAPDSFQWSAKWIWHPPVEPMSNFYLYARKSLALTEVPAAVDVAVTAGSLYKLYVNGRFVGRGPNPGDPSHYYFDTYDVAAFLRPGENVIAAVCHNYGPETTGVIGQNWGRGGFLLELRGDGVALAATDDSWRVLRAPPWDRNAEVNCTLYGDYKETYDSREEIEGWMEAGFDDAGWVVPCVLGTPPVAPYRHLVEREIPPLGGARVHPENVSWESASVTYAWREDWEVHGDQGLVAGRISAGEMKPVEIRKTHADFAPSLLCDFGRDVTGYPEIHIRDSRGGVIDVLYGEDLFLVRVDRFILKGGAQVLQPFNRRTFRYLKLLVVEAPGPILLDEVSMRMDTFPVEYVGGFSCSDDLLNRVWEVGRYTMQMCMLDHFVDCPWRERTIYGGDVYAENLIAHYAFGDPRLNRKTLRQMFAIQHPEGALPPYGPYRGCHAFYPSWTAFFALAFVDHYRLTGDLDFLREGWPHLEKILEWTIGQMARNANGLIGSPAKSAKFPEWMTAEKVTFAGHTNVPFFLALKGGAELAGVLGHEEKAERFTEAARRLAASMRAHSIDPELGSWCSDGQGRLPRSRQVDHGCLLWGQVLSDPLARRLAGLIRSPELIPVSSPFDGMFVLLGLFQYGEDVQALRFIREYWGNMLGRGATTMWEHFSLDWPAKQQPDRGVSLCHAWSAAPTYALPAYVLGVTPLAPGFREIAIAPQLGDLRWARGDVPTPHGVVHVEWELGDSAFRLQIDLPEGTTGRVTLPRLPPHLNVSVNGVESHRGNDGSWPAVVLAGARPSNTEPRTGNENHGLQDIQKLETTD